MVKTTLFLTLTITAMVILLISQDSNAQSNNGLVLWNTMGSDSELQNSIVGPSLTALQTLTYSATMNGNGVLSNNDDPVIQIPSSVLNSAEGTISLWVKFVSVPTSFPNATEHLFLFSTEISHRFTANDGLAHSGWLSLAGSNRIYSINSFGTTSTSSLGINDEAVLITIRWDSSGVTGHGTEELVFYRNDLKVGTYVAGGAVWPATFSGDLMLNKAQFNPNLASGTVDLDLIYDDIKVYNRSLLDQDVVDLYNGISPLFLQTTSNIVFISNRDGNNEVYVMDSDGSNQIRLTNNSALEHLPSLSPDGTQIVFSSTREGNHKIYLMNIDGSNLTRLTNNTFDDLGPVISPDGSKIVYESKKHGNSEVFVMNADGTNQTRLTGVSASEGWNYGAVWSPDGSNLAFRSDRGGNSNIWIMDADGSNVFNLTNSSPAWEEGPSWSPDGNSIAFHSKSSFSTSIKWDIWVINKDGTNPVNFTNSLDYDDINPWWSPDGNQITFATNRSGDGEIYVMDRDEANPVNISNEPSSIENMPRWGTSSAVAPIVANPITDITVEEDFGSTIAALLDSVFANIGNLGSPLAYELSMPSDLIMGGISGDTLRLFSVDDAYGSGDVIVAATNDSSLSVSDTFKVTINSVNDLPVVANPITDVVADEDFGSISVALLNSVFDDSDLPNDSLRYTVSVSSGVISAAVAGDRLWLFSVTDLNGIAEVIVTATDDSSASVSDSFMVTVNPVENEDRITGATLSGGNSVPPVTTSATGTFTGVLTNDWTELHYAITIEGLTPTAAHFHNGAFDETGDVVKSLDFSDGMTISGVWSASDGAQPFTTEMLDELLAGRIYVNIHTSANPGGEIRGNILTAVPFRASLSGDKSVPPVSSSGVGTGGAVLVGAERALIYGLNVTGLTPTASHFHGGSATGTGGVVKTIDLVNDNAVGLWTGFDTQPLTDGLISDLLLGNVYMNVHTSSNPGGELRSQLEREDATTFLAFINGGNHSPPISSIGSGMAFLTLNSERTEVEYDITISQITPTAAHFHNAGAGISAGVVKTLDFNNGHASGVWSTSDGTQPLTANLVEELLSGRLYVNVHTTAYPGGEIRGQVQAFSGYNAQLSGSQSVPAITSSGSGTLTGSLVYDDTGAHFAYNITVNGLNITNSHFHAGSAGESGGVIKAITFDGNSAQGVWSAGDEQPLTNDIVDMIRSGGVYVNIHTSANPGGEIRGQLLPGIIEVSIDDMNNSPFVSNSIMDVVDDEDFGSIYVALLGNVFDDSDLPNDSLRYMVSVSSGLVTAVVAGDTLWLFSVADLNGMAEVIVTAADDSSASVSDSFNVTVLPVGDNPASFKLAFPLGDTLNTLLPPFRWHPSVDPDIGDLTVYIIRISAFESLQLPIYTGTFIDTSYTLAVPLADDSLYYWSVTAFDTSGGFTFSDTSSFLLDKQESPELFSLIDPADGGGVDSLRPVFTWELSIDPDPRDEVKYTLIIRRITGPDSIVYKSEGIADSSHQVTADIEIGSYEWWVIAEDSDDESLDTKSSEVFSLSVIVGIDDEFAGIPEEFNLYQNYPNPFNPSTIIRYALPKSSNISLVIYNLMGQEIMRWDESNVTPGYYDKTWNGTTRAGIPVSSGIYIYRITAGDFVQTRKMVLLK